MHQKWWKLALIACVIALAVLWLMPDDDEVEDTRPLRIATNPWPGYEYLYLAEKKGFFKQEGGRIQLIRFTSLEDARRAFELDQVDGITCTLIELLYAYEHGTVGKIAIITDFSNGSDILIARAGIQSVVDLKGKKIGVEPATLSTFFVSRALQESGLSLDDITAKGMNPLDMEDALLSGKVDAAHVYPPASFDILKHTDKVANIFDSSKIPGEVVDLVAFNAQAFTNHKKDIEALQRAWDRAHHYASHHPEEANAIMGDMEGLTAQQFAESLKDIKVLHFSEQQKILNGPALLDTIQQVKHILVKDKEITSDPPPETFLPPSIPVQ